MDDQNAFGTNDFQPLVSNQLLLEQDLWFVWTCHADGYKDNCRTTDYKTFSV